MARTRNKNIYLKCPRCGQIARWAGQGGPALALTLCYRCGYAGPGAKFKRAKAGEARRWFEEHDIPK